MPDGGLGWPAFGGGGGGGGGGGRPGTDGELSFPGHEEVSSMIELVVVDNVTERLIEGLPPEEGRGGGGGGGGGGGFGGVAFCCGVDGVGGGGGGGGGIGFC